MKTMRPYKAGQAVLLNDFRPNSEQLLATGSLQEENMSDYILYDAFLVPTDKLYTVKREVLEAQGLKVRFPLLWFCLQPPLNDSCRLLMHDMYTYQ